MNAEDFVKAIRTAVCNAAANGTVEILKHPPGRKPVAELTRLSDFYHRLSPEDRENVAGVADLVADQATYNFLLILDGLLAVEPVGAKGRLDLLYDDGVARTRLNDVNKDHLSSLFKQLR